MATLDLDILQGSLEHLVGDDAQIAGAAIVSPDGLILVSTFADKDFNDQLGAMVSEMLNPGMMAVRELDCGEHFLSMVLGTTGGLIVRGIDGEMVLALQITRGANVGKVVTAANRTVARIQAL